MNRKSIGVMPSLNSVRPVEVNGGEEVVTVGEGSRKYAWSGRAEYA